MTDRKHGTAKSARADEKKKNFMDMVEEIVDDTSHKIMNEAGDINHRLEAVVDDLEEMVSDGLKTVKEGARRVVEYAEDSMEAAELRRDIHKLREDMNTAYKDAGKKMWELHRSNQLDTAQQVFAREINRMKKLQDQIDKKEKALEASQTDES